MAGDENKLPPSARQPFTGLPDCDDGDVGGDVYGAAAAAAAAAADDDLAGVLGERVGDCCC